MSEELFYNQKRHPDEDDLRKRIGRSYQMIEETLKTVDTEYGSISTDWKYSTTSGWYIVGNRKKRRLFYLIPLKGGFVWKMVFGEKALEKIRNGDFPGYISKMTVNAKRYAEGTLYVFTRSNYKVKTMIELLKIKIET
jgi:hypothetical protein